MTARRPPTWLWWAVGLLAVLALASLPGVRSFLQDAWTALSNDDASVRRAWVDRFGVWGPLALIAGMLAQAALPLLPAAADVMIASLAYGPRFGFVIVYTGTLLGAVLGYVLGRATGGRLIARLAGEKLAAHTEAFALRRGWQAVLLIRLMPALKAEVMNLMAGAVGIPFWPFFLASAAGALPATALVVWLAATPERLVWGVVLFSAGTGVVMPGALVAGSAGCELWATAWGAEGGFPDSVRLHKKTRTRRVRWMVAADALAQSPELTAPLSYFSPMYLPQPSRIWANWP